ncbi:MAG: hypothetical protein A4E72_01406 [Syntrophus sp. PtaU1.Bin208]|nr:MAG: hypothetical protein A4E72_01406 [Syntrophus sp. PtaU1.Bin208]
MTKKEMQERIEQLERTVGLLEKELELRRQLAEYAAKQPVYVPYPVPQYPPYWYRWSSADNTDVRRPS